MSKNIIKKTKMNIKISPIHVLFGNSNINKKLKLKLTFNKNENETIKMK